MGSHRGARSKDLLASAAAATAQHEPKSKRHLSNGIRNAVQSSGECVVIASVVDSN
jgi:hypothetical protein